MTLIRLEESAPQRTASQPEPIPLCVPEIAGNEWQYVKECLDTGWVSSVGAYVERFERMIADHSGSSHAVATMNGTSALHIALLLAGVGPGDEVLVSTLTFIAPVNAIRYVGAVPVFIDAEPVYWQMDSAAVAHFLENECERRQDKIYNRRTGRRVAAILPVHILGHSVDLDPVLAAAASYGLPVIEDASEGIGAAYKGRPLGSLGDAGCFSFNGNKIITTGGGGMLVTHSDAWAERARYLTTQAKDDPVEYIHGDVGYNYRMTNMLAALGCAQMERLAYCVAAKRQIAARYDAAFSDMPGLQPMRTAPWATSTAWMYTMLVQPAFGLSSRELLRELAREKIQTRPLWQPIHRSPAYTGFANGPLPVAEQLAAEALSLPCSVGLTAVEQDRVIAGILDAGKHAGRSRC